MRKTKLYSLSTQSSYQSPWAQCVSLAWLKSDPGRKSSWADLQALGIMDLSEVPGKIGLRVDDGWQWPDWLRAGDLELSCYVSERVVQALIDEEIPFRRAIEFPIAEIHSAALRKLAPPKYYVIEVDVGIEVAPAPVDGPFPPSHPSGKPPECVVRGAGTEYFAKYDTWDGSSLFTIKAPEGWVQRHVRLFGDHRVTFLAMKEKWTNFQATELSVI